MGIGGLVVTGFLAQQAYAEHMRLARLLALLNAGQVQRVEGKISDVLIWNAKKGVVIFTVQGQRFQFPSFLPHTCWPLKGELARVGFVPDPDGRGIKGVRNDLVELALTRGCAQGS
jgi:hypothetical protein